jgi:hypothetical protein
MENATIRERALLHLNRFLSMTPSELFNVPFDLTQDGIASVLGISRAHASLELKKLKETGKVDDWLAHIKGSGTKRKVYYLLPDGIAEAELLKKRFEASGIAVDALLDMKRCEPEVMWDNLNIKDKETFGLACVFRVPIERRTLPDTTSGVIPANFFGMTCITDDVREKYLSLSAPDKIKVWHSQAADWWMDNKGEGGDKERFYHLTGAGRNTEACKFIVKMSEEFLDDPDEDLLFIMKGLVVIPKYAKPVYNIRARTALDCGDAKDALVCADVLAGLGEGGTDAIRAEAYMLSGDNQKGFDMAAAMFSKDPSAKTALIAARCLFRMKKYSEASELVDSSCVILSDNNDATDIGGLLLLKAGIAYTMGKTDDTLSYLNKAKRASHKKKTKDKIDALTKNIKNGKKVSFD